MASQGDEVAIPISRNQLPVVLRAEQELILGGDTSFCKGLFWRTLCLGHKPWSHGLDIDCFWHWLKKSEGQYSRLGCLLLLNNLRERLWFLAKIVLKEGTLDLFWWTRVWGLGLRWRKIWGGLFSVLERRPLKHSVSQADGPGRRMISRVFWWQNWILTQGGIT